MRPVTLAIAMPCTLRSRRWRSWSAKTLSKKSMAQVPSFGPERHAGPARRELGAQAVVAVGVLGFLDVVEAVERRAHAAILDVLAGAQARQADRHGVDLEELAGALAVERLGHHLRALGVDAALVDLGMRVGPELAAPPLGARGQRLVAARRVDVQLVGERIGSGPGAGKGSSGFGFFGVVAQIIVGFCQLVVVAAEGHAGPLVDDPQIRVELDQVLAALDDVDLAQRLVGRGAAAARLEVELEAGVRIVERDVLDENLEIPPLGELHQVLEVALPLEVRLGERLAGALGERGPRDRRAWRAAAGTPPAAARRRRSPSRAVPSSRPFSGSCS